MGQAVRWGRKGQNPWGSQNTTVRHAPGIPFCSTQSSPEHRAHRHPWIIHILVDTCPALLWRPSEATVRLTDLQRYHDLHSHDGVGGQDLGKSKTKTSTKASARLGHAEQAVERGYPLLLSKTNLGVCWQPICVVELHLEIVSVL
jgi:hypothetical protein